MSSRNRVGECRLCSSVSGYGQVSCSCCQHGSGSSVSMKFGGISELTEEILASQEELFSMELVKCTFIYPYKEACWI